MIEADTIVYAIVATWGILEFIAFCWLGVLHDREDNKDKK